MGVYQLVNQSWRDLPTTSDGGGRWDLNGQNAKKSQTRPAARFSENQGLLVNASKLVLRF